MNPGDRVEAAISNAASATGVSASFLRTVAAQESSFDPQARASTSSAAGLFQFIEETWLRTLATHGRTHGFAQEAAQITHTEDGRLRVMDTRTRQAVLSLRLDPEASALMAGALASDNASVLETRLGRPPQAGEMYMAHVLGVNGAVRLIETVASRPDMPAAELFPAAARANRGLFYDAHGAERNVEGLAQRLAQRFQPPTSGPSGRAGGDLGGGGELQSPVLRAALEGRTLNTGDIVRRPVVRDTQPVLLSTALVEALASLDPPATRDTDDRDRKRANAGPAAR